MRRAWTLRSCYPSLSLLLFGLHVLVRVVPLLDDGHLQLREGARLFIRLLLLRARDANLALSEHVLGILKASRRPQELVVRVEQLGPAPLQPSFVGNGSSSIA